VIWSDISTHILEETKKRENVNWNVDDINLFLASQLVMGLTPEPSIEDYFKIDSDGIFGSNWMKQRFTASWWSNIHSHIHYDSNVCINLLRNNFQKAWNLDQVLVVDEMLIPFTGRWKYIQYIKGKPHNTSLKMFCLADSNFYIWDFWLYKGDESERSTKPMDIVLDFVLNATKTQHKPFYVVADSYYGSLKLAEILHEKKIGCLFSCKSDRPANLFSKFLHNNLEKGSFNYTNNRDFSAMTYFDKAKVNLITNLFLCNKIAQNSTQKKSMPVGLYWYRRWLGGVDHFDRWLHLYLTSHRNIKWTQALLSALLKIAVGNTNIIANNSGFDTNLKNSTIEIIKYLAKDTTFRKERGANGVRKGFEHFPMKMDKAKLCVECNKKGSRSNTKYICKVCEIPLHAECFESFHVND
jgi:uncharacterized protein YihD (DUF1040 family)